jgi:HKD family nuclease
MPSSLTTGAENPLLLQLLKAINEADQIEIAVVFVKSTGLNLIFDALVDTIERGAAVSILTSHYLSVTDPESLRGKPLE